jgi:hypothetical protein
MEEKTNSGALSSVCGKNAQYTKGVIALIKLKDKI